jgi:hypothetical protein
MRTMIGRTLYLFLRPVHRVLRPVHRVSRGDTSRRNPATLRVRRGPDVQDPLCSVFAKNAMRVLWLLLRSLGQER